jgi:DNA primase
MRYPPQLLEEIRARLPVSQVVSRRVKLKRQGREYIGLSPFKTEKSPSFTVNDQKGFYHCFSTGEHGDIFSFVMKTEGLQFFETVERLAAEAGVTLPKESPEAAREQDQRQRLLDLVEASCLYFEAALASPAGSEARAYIDKRGVQPQLRREFRLGFAPDRRTGLLEHLKNKGFSVQESILAGMLIGGDDIPTPYDRFRNRLIIPIRDQKGRIIAFGGRALAADAKPKYLNSPETPLFHKGGVLFNHDKARAAAHEAGAVVVVEGYMDVIALAGAGIGYAVAPLGTALTEHQLGLAWRMHAEPILCFDGDAAGIKAAFRSIDTALPHLKPGYSLRFAFLPGGLDPDDLIRPPWQRRNRWRTCSGSARLPAATGQRRNAARAWSSKSEHWSIRLATPVCASTTPKPCGIGCAACGGAPAHREDVKLRVVTLERLKPGPAASRRHAVRAPTARAASRCPAIGHRCRLRPATVSS